MHTTNQILQNWQYEESAKIIIIIYVFHSIYYYQAVR